MGPKVDAVCEFVRATGNRAAIGSLTDVAEVFAGTQGTQVLPELPAGADPHQ
jgi:carbamate kinase